MSMAVFGFTEFSSPCQSPVFRRQVNRHNSFHLFHSQPHSQAHFLFLHGWAIRSQWLQWVPQSIHILSDNCSHLCFLVVCIWGLTYFLKMLPSLALLKLVYYMPVQEVDFFLLRYQIFKSYLNTSLKIHIPSLPFYLMPTTVEIYIPVMRWQTPLKHRNNNIWFYKT